MAEILLYVRNKGSLCIDCMPFILQAVEGKGRRRNSSLGSVEFGNIKGEFLAVGTKGIVREFLRKVDEIVKWYKLEDSFYTFHTRLVFNDFLFR